ncbi:hypothetical protein C8R47DRAFT_1258133, partial [Mycena vitilis]
VAIIYEADEPSSGCSITYASLLSQVCQLANVLQSTFGVKKGDTVFIYLPMTYHAAVAFLACARIGAIHSVIFAGFSAESLRDRINDCGSRVLITSDEGRRGGKSIATKAIVDKALEQCPAVAHCLVLKLTGGRVGWVEGRDRGWEEECAKDPLFILYCTRLVRVSVRVSHSDSPYPAPGLTCPPSRTRNQLNVGNRRREPEHDPPRHGVGVLRLDAKCSTPVKILSLATCMCKV